MTVILAGRFQQETVLLADVFAANGPLDDASCFSLEEKVFAFAGSESFLGVCGDEAFACVLSRKAAWPREDFTLPSGTPFEDQFMDGVSALAGRYRELAEGYAAKKQLETTGFMETTVYCATRKLLVRWTFEPEGDGYVRRGGPSEIIPGMMMIDCGGWHQPRVVPKRAAATFAELVPEMQCPDHLPYEVGEAITGVWLPAAERDAITLRSMDALSDDDKRVRLRLRKSGSPRRS